MINRKSLSLFGAFGAIVFSSIIYFNGLANKCSVEVKGRLAVKTKFLAFNEEIKPLIELPIKISLRVGNDRDENELLTSLNGSFNSTFYFKPDSNNTCEVKTLKVETSFVHGEKLSITRGDWDIIKTWDLVANQHSHQCNDGMCDLGDLIFGPESSIHSGLELGDEIHQNQANAWWASMYLINYVENLGYPFKSRLAIAYPFDEINSQWESRLSYANPLTRQVQIVNELFTRPIGELLYHEIGHIWSYDYSKNSGDLLSYFLLNGFSTHGILSSKSVAFYEGFAETFGNYIYRELLRSEGIQNTDLIFKRNFSEKGYLTPKPMQSFKFEHERFNPNDHAFGIDDDGWPVTFLDSAEFKSWTDLGDRCVHHQYGTFDCSDPGWMSIFHSLLLEGLSSDTFRTPELGSLINYDIMILSEFSNGRLVSQPNTEISNDSNCVARPTISFSELLESFKGDTGELIDSEHMSIDGYFNRIKKMELGNITDDESGHRMLGRLKNTFNLENDQAGNYYNNFCSPSIFSLLTTHNTIGEGVPNFFEWIRNTDGEAVLSLNYLVKPTESLQDILSAKYMVSGSMGGAAYIRKNGSNVEEASIQETTNYWMLNNFDEQDMSLLEFTGDEKYHVVLEVPLKTNNSFPVTTMSARPIIGCPIIGAPNPMVSSLFFTSDNYVGDENFWGEYNCIFGEDNSINNFEMPNSDNNWVVDSASITFGVDFHLEARSTFLLPTSTAYNSTKTNTFDFGIINTAYARNNQAAKGGNSKIKKSSFERSKSGMQKRNFRREIRKQRERQKASGPKLRGDYLEKQFSPDEYYGICHVKNIGNVAPGIATKIKMYTFEGNVSDLKTSQNEWVFHGESHVPNLIPNAESIYGNRIELESPGMLYLRKSIAPGSAPVKLSDPVYLICTVNDDNEIEELDHENGVVITKVRDAIYYTNGIKLSSSLVMNSRDELLNNKNIRMSEMINDLHQSLLENDVNQALNIFNSSDFDNLIQFGPSSYLFHIKNEYQSFR